MIEVKIYVKMPHLKWCFEHFGFNFRHYQGFIRDAHKGPGLHRWLYDEQHLYFQNEEDATFFKLRWF